MHRLLILLGFLTSLSAVGAEHRVLLMPFKILDGQTVECPVTMSGPLPAESGPYKVVGAGFGLAKNADGGVSLAFGFDVVVADTGKPTRIVVEDVTGATPEVLVDDPHPQLVNGRWSGNAEPVVVADGSPPWLFDRKATIKVYRFTLSAKDRADTVLYQPASFSLQTKAAIVQMARGKN
jgi:hypothetical protein